MAKINQAQQLTKRINQVTHMMLRPRQHGIIESAQFIHCFRSSSPKVIRQHKSRSSVREKRGSNTNILRQTRFRRRKLIPHV